ncbi:hypothetical protein WJX84_009069 [Apatococcus fuscideae]|uniref:Uncharacterized protein n=1 Tax=Apatococcus fuscideae TaxID=2026836 RepID=A0AAW1T3T0_9CHLO
MRLERPSCRTQTTGQGCVSLYRSAAHPYIQEKLKRFLKPVLIACLAVFLSGKTLAVPVQGLAWGIEILSLAKVKQARSAELGQGWMKDAVAFVPMIAMLIIRSFFRHPMYKCFIHMLREINPQLSARLESSGRLRNPDRSKSGFTRLQQRWDTALKLLTFSLMIYTWRHLPVIGKLASPIVHMITWSKLVGPKRAAILSAVALLPFLEHWALRVVEIWRAANLLGQELLGDYISRSVPYAERKKWWREHGLTVTVFLVPHVALMALPMVGPLAFIPVQAAAAWLVDLIESEAGPQPLRPDSQAHKAAEMTPLTHPQPPTRGQPWAGAAPQILQQPVVPEQAGMVYPGGQHPGSHQPMGHPQRNDVYSPDPHVSQHSAGAEHFYNHNPSGDHGS